MTRVRIERVARRGNRARWMATALAETLVSAVRAQLAGERSARPAGMSNRHVRIVRRAADEVATRVRAAHGTEGSAET